MRKTAICFCALLFFFFLGASLMAVDADELKSVSERPPGIQVEEEGAAVQNRYGVPRKQVLLELFERPT